MSEDINCHSLPPTLVSSLNKSMELKKWLIIGIFNDNMNSPLILDKENIGDMMNLFYPLNLLVDDENGSFIFRTLEIFQIPTILIFDPETKNCIHQFENLSSSFNIKQTLLSFISLHRKYGFPSCIPETPPQYEFNNLAKNSPSCLHIPPRSRKSILIEFNDHQFNKSFEITNKFNQNNTEIYSNKETESELKKIHNDVNRINNENDKVNIMFSNDKKTYFVEILKDEPFQKAIDSYIFNILRQKNSDYVLQENNVDFFIGKEKIKSHWTPNDIGLMNFEKISITVHKRYEKKVKIRIVIVFLFPDIQKIYKIINYHQKFSKILNSICKRKNIKRENVSFYCKCKMIEDEDTPEITGIQSGDVIIVRNKIPLQQKKNLPYSNDKYEAKSSMKSNCLLI